MTAGLGWLVAAAMAAVVVAVLGELEPPPLDLVLEVMEVQDLRFQSPELHKNTPGVEQALEPLLMAELGALIRQTPV